MVDLLVYATVVFAIVRAVPVLWEGRRYVAPVRSAGRDTTGSQAGW